MGGREEEGGGGGSAGEEALCQGRRTEERRRREDREGQGERRWRDDVWRGRFLHLVSSLLFAALDFYMGVATQSISFLLAKKLPALD